MEEDFRKQLTVIYLMTLSLFALMCLIGYFFD